MLARVSSVVQTTYCLTRCLESLVTAKQVSGMNSLPLFPARRLDAVTLMTSTTVPTGVTLKPRVTILTSMIAQPVTWNAQVASHFQ